MSSTSVLLETLPRSEHVKFTRNEGFMRTLKERVNQYFSERQLAQKDHPGLYVKTAIILTWVTASYIWLLMGVDSALTASAACVSLGLAMAAVGFNIQHDGGHGAYSRFPIVNRLMAFTLDLLGGSSYIWKRTHNIVHHSFTNVTGVDGDIDLGVLGRLSPHQRRYPFHRLQHLYLWFLYGFVTLKWQFHDDMKALFLGRVGTTRVPRPKSKELAILIAGKILFFSLAFGIPLMMHSWTHVLLCFFAASFVQGVVLSVVFQLAHVVEEADFPIPQGSAEQIENEWARHQVETTVDFAQNSRIVSWFTGGLNFQIEHHLFPQICHMHYPAIAEIVRQTSKEFGIQYNSQPNVFSALRSHYRWLRQMGAVG